ncbi:MAG: type II toxin-antitoxin system PemK/MazF family toxin [Actinomycetota bacterium]
MVIDRGGIYWADLGLPEGSRPAKRRPVLVIQADSFNESRLATVLAAVITSNTALAAMPGNVFLPSAISGLPRDSVVNVTALVTLNKSELDEKSGQISDGILDGVNCGLRVVLEL